LDKRTVILRYHEIALKGRNRKWFEQRLATNAKRLVSREILGELSGEKEKISATLIDGRILLKAPWTNETRSALRRLFGLTSFSAVRPVKTDPQALVSAGIEALEDYLKDHEMPERFRVRTRRSHKALSATSMELDTLIGSAIKTKYPTLTVDLKNADFTLGVEIRTEESFVWSTSYQALGGLPVGTNASTLTLLSGGLDSPVAAIQILSRGSPTSFIHFHGVPFVGDQVLDKICRLAELVNRFQPHTQPLYVIPFGNIQEKIALAVHPKMRTVIYRRMMIRIASEVAKKIGVLALVTGESLGQVASQTLENLSTINSVAEIPILRPLIGMDKDKIIELAQRYETFSTSIEPTLDCCTLFADRHPILRSTDSTALEQERKFSVSDLVAEALSGMRTLGGRTGDPLHPIQ